MAIFNTNEFLRKTFSKTIFGTAALRPEAVCADGFTLSIQASGMHYCIPNEDLEYEFNKTGDIDFYSGELYLNAIGDVVSGCDWSYKSQKKYRFGNVMNKNWLENISNSELYIAS